MNALNIRALAGLLQLVVIMAALIFVPAGSLDYPQAWIFLAVFFTPVGPIIAAPYLAPELFEGLEGLEAFGKMGIIAVPGPTLMGQGAVGVWQKCF